MTFCDPGCKWDDGEGVGVHAVGGHRRADTGCPPGHGGRRKAGGEAVGMEGSVCPPRSRAAA